MLAELGRQPRTAKRFVLRFSDQILMGKDAWAPEEYHVYFRTLETEDVHPVLPTTPRVLAGMLARLAGLGT